MICSALEYYTFSLHLCIALLMVSMFFTPLSRRSIVKCCLHEDIPFLTGITFSGLDEPLVVGQPATITCTTNIAVSTIEWRNQSSDMLTSITDSMVLEYIIPLVTDDLHGQQFTCVAVAGATTYTEMVKIEVVGKCLHADNIHNKNTYTFLQSLLTLWRW